MEDSKKHGFGKDAHRTLERPPAKPGPRDGHGQPLSSIGEGNTKSGEAGVDANEKTKPTRNDDKKDGSRVVHARGSAAHGVFEAYENLSRLTRASVFADVGKQTPVFVRFSTMAGERGSTDTARDVRGFAVKFYTDEGNWDLVGNNMPVFFIQDAMKFPDLVHAVKPEPHHAIPQASSAHDTFWDFVSLTPESTHMLMWQMSDRAIPRSYRTMQGFGVHTFRLINAEGASVFCKFHWNPMAATHSLVWDEAVHISGEPNSLAGGCPFQAGTSGYVSFPQPVTGDKVRGKPQKFSEHFAQARLFWKSQTVAEQNHIVSAFRFELTRVQTVAIRNRVLSMLANVDETLVGRVAAGLGLEVPDAMPRALDAPVADLPVSPPLSLMHRPGETGIATRRVALLAGAGVDGASVRTLYADLLRAGAVPRVVGMQLGDVETAQGDPLGIEISLETGPSVLYDGVIVPDHEGELAFATDAHALDFVRLQFRHCKPIMVAGSGAGLIKRAGIPVRTKNLDAGMIGWRDESPEQAFDAFSDALAGHRAFERETDPPVV